METGGGGERASSSVCLRAQRNRSARQTGRRSSIRWEQVLILLRGFRFSLSSNMESAGGEVVQRTEKVTLRRKLTGPPRLLLQGRAKKKSADRPKTRTNNNKSSETDTIHQDVSSAAHMQTSRGRCGAADGDDDVRNRRRHRWWRRFRPELACVRRQRAKSEDGLGKKKNRGCAPPEGALQETHNAAPEEEEEEEENSEEVTAGRSRFKVRTWIRRIMTRGRDSAEDEDKASVNVRRKLRDFLRRGRRSRKSSVEEGEETPQSEEEECSPAALTSEVMRGSLEVVTAEVREDPAGAQSPNRTETRDLEEEKKKEEEEEDKQTDDAPEEEFQMAPSSEGGHEARTDHAPPQFPRPNGPSILIQLVPPDDETLDDEEDEIWEVSTSPENPNLLFLLLATEPGERQLLQTARSLVRAAMSAAVDQLIREQSELDCELRETLAAQRFIQTLN